jgi:hypothetical protein
MKLRNYFMLWFYSKRGLAIENRNLRALYRDQQRSIDRLTAALRESYAHTTDVDRVLRELYDL